MAVTMNGYTRIDAVDSRLAHVAVAGHTTYLLRGPVAAVLAEVGRRFNAEVEAVSTFNGWRSAALNAASGGITTSNHLSGTAVDINGYRHPRYKHGTFTAAQVATIRRILADLGGVVRWGGDWNGDGRLTEADTDEMHFEVVGPLATVTAVANQIGHTGTVPTVPTLPDLPDLPELKPLEDKMLYLARTPDGTIWVGDGVTRRALPDLQAVADLQDRFRSGKLTGDPEVNQDGRAEWLGERIDEDPLKDVGKSLAALDVQFDSFDADVRGDLLNKGAQIAALTAAVHALATAQGLDPDAITAAARAGAEAALAGLTLKAQ